MKYISLIVLIAFLASCSTQETMNQNNTSSQSTTQESEVSQSETQEATSSDTLQQSEEKTSDINIKDTQTISVELNSEDTQVNSENIQMSGQILTIKKSGNYEFSGTLENGQIVVETQDEKDVQIILNNVDISNDFGPAILVNNASQVVVTLADSSQNNLSDGDDYTFEDEDEGTGWAIFSKDDLVIQWNGTLNVVGNLSDGIVSKDELYIDNGNIEVIAADDGIRGKDYLGISQANISITAQWDGLKSNDDEKATIVINSGDIKISAGDDAIHSEINIVINGGDIEISKSYEGIEAQYITFNDGNIYVTSSDDGINATAWWTSSSRQEWNFQGQMPEMRDRPEFDESMQSSRPTRPQGDFGRSNRQMGWFGWGGWQQDDGSVVYFNGWKVVLNSNGDGFDSNGKIIMIWGTITIFWPEWNGNGSIDYNGSFEITGGEVIAIWSSGMVQTPESSEQVNTINVWLSQSYSSGQEIIISDAQAEVLFKIDSIKTFQNIVISSQKFILWENYTLSIWWEVIQEIEISDSITKVGTFNSRF